MKKNIKKPPELIKFSEFFFKQKLFKKRTPLFDSQIKMAETLIQDKSNPFYQKNITTVRSAISQVFSGERNVSGTLEKAFKRSIELLLGDNVHSKTAVQEFEKLLSEWRLVWKGWAVSRIKGRLEDLLQHPGIQDRLKYVYDPKIMIDSSDAEYLLSVVNGSGGKVSMEILMALLKQRKQS